MHASNNLAFHRTMKVEVKANRVLLIEVTMRLKVTKVEEWFSHPKSLSQLEFAQSGYPTFHRIGGNSAPRISH